MNQDAVVVRTMTTAAPGTETETTETPTWAQLSTESSKAFRAFAIYREIAPGRRSIDRAYQHATGNEAAPAPGTWRAWSSKFSWVERAKDYDRHVDAIEREALAERRAEDAKTLHDTGRALISLAAGALLTALRDDPKTVSSHAAVRAIEAGAALMRDARGIGIERRAIPEDVAATLEAIIEEFGRRALEGDTEAAKVVLQAAQRKAEAEGTDAPQTTVFTTVEASMQMLFGVGSPDDLPPELRRMMVKFIRSQRPLSDDQNNPDEWMRRRAEELGLPVPKLALQIRDGAGDGAGVADAEPNMS